MFRGVICMKSATMHKCNACIRLISILCMVACCYSQTCDEGQIAFSTYSPIVTGLICQTQVNGQYEYIDQSGSAQRYQNSNGILLYRRTDTPTQHYIFAAASTATTSACLYSVNCLNGWILLANTHMSGVNAGVIPLDIVERCGNLASLTFTKRTNSFSRNHIKCVCATGWAASPSGVCEQCIAGKYKDPMGNFACSNCPVHSNSGIGSKSCTCNSGYMRVDAGSGEYTEECSTGTYPRISEAGCEPCATGTYKTEAGPAQCNPCPTGTYQTQQGSANCTECPVGEYSTVTGAISANSCIACVRGTYPRNNGGGCDPCATGTYKTQTGSWNCTSCPVGAYTTAMGADSANLCIACAAGNHPRSDGAACETCPSSYSASVLSNAFSGIGPMPGCIQFVGA